MPSLTMRRWRSVAPKRSWLTELAGHKRVTRIQGSNSRLWITAEWLPHYQALWPGARVEPKIKAPAQDRRESSHNDAVVEILRGRLEGLGPVATSVLTSP